MAHRSRVPDEVIGCACKSMFLGWVVCDESLASVDPMTLALRLLFSFGLLALVATGTVGLGAREAWRRAEEQRFSRQLEAASQGVSKELGWETSQMRDLLHPKCAHDAYIDQTLIELERHELDAGRRLAISQLVADEMKALHLDELLLYTGTGEILGAGHDPAAAGKSTVRSRASRRLPAPTSPCEAPAGELPQRSSPAARRSSAANRSRSWEPATLARCSTVSERRMGCASRPRGQGSPAAPNEARRGVGAPSPELAGLGLSAAISRRELDENLASVDTWILLSSAITLAVAIVAAIWMARSLAGPLEELAHQAGEVVRGEPRPVEARGSRELRLLAQAFNKALEDLVQLRKRLATTERIAARREIGRRVAHEIENPLAPIRAAVETLRRLRARDDPAFDDYFDEATRTVLSEVFRITRIVSEFTEFARLPAPRLGPVSLEEIAKSTVALYAAGGADVTLRTSPCPPTGRSRPARPGADQPDSKRSRCGWWGKPSPRLPSKSNRRDPITSRSSCRTTDPVSAKRCFPSSSSLTRRPSPTEPGSVWR